MATCKECGHSSSSARITSFREILPLFPNSTHKFNLPPVIPRQIPTGLNTTLLDVCKRGGRGDTIPPSVKKKSLVVFPSGSFCRSSNLPTSIQENSGMEPHILFHRYCQIKHLSFLKWGAWSGGEQSGRLEGGK